MSEFVSCPIGVPKGSILGPLLFVIFFNDLPKEISCQADLYADDKTLSASGRNIAEISNELTEACCKVSHWMKANRLKLNPEKTHLLLMRTQQKLNSADSTLQIQMDGIL